MNCRAVSMSDPSEEIDEPAPVPALAHASARAGAPTVPARAGAPTVPTPDGDLLAFPAAANPTSVLPTDDTPRREDRHRTPSAEPRRSPNPTITMGGEGVHARPTPERSPPPANGRPTDAQCVEATQRAESEHRVAEIIRKAGAQREAATRHAENTRRVRANAEATAVAFAEGQHRAATGSRLNLPTATPNPVRNPVTPVRLSLQEVRDFRSSTHPRGQASGQRDPASANPTPAQLAELDRCATHVALNLGRCDQPEAADLIAAVGGHDLLSRRGAQEVISRALERGFARRMPRPAAAAPTAAAPTTLAGAPAMPTSMEVQRWNGQNPKHRRGVEPTGDGAQPPYRATKTWARSQRDWSQYKIKPVPGRQRPNQSTPPRLEASSTQTDPAPAEAQPAPVPSAARAATTHPTQPTTPNAPTPHHLHHTLALVGGETARRLANAEHGNDRPRIVRFENERPEENDTDSPTDSPEQLMGGEGETAESLRQPPYTYDEDRAYYDALAPTATGAAAQSNGGAHERFTWTYPDQEESLTYCRCRRVAELSTWTKQTPNFGRQYFECGHPRSDRRCELFSWREHTDRVRMVTETPRRGAERSKPKEKRDRRRPQPTLEPDTTMNIPPRGLTFYGTPGRNDGRPGTTRSNPATPVNQDGAGKPTYEPDTPEEERPGGGGN